MPELKMKQLAKVLDRESYEWLGIHHPDILAAIEAEIAAGQKPEGIRYFVIRQTGRIELAQRCEQAARHAEAMGGGER